MHLVPILGLALVVFGAFRFFFEADGTRPDATPSESSETQWRRMAATAAIPRRVPPEWGDTHRTEQDDDREPVKWPRGVGAGVQWCRESKSGRRSARGSPCATAKGLCV